MARQTEGTGSKPEFSISKETVKEISRFAVRLVGAGLLVTLLMVYSAPWIEISIARGARNLLALVSSPYYLKSIDFVESGYVFTTWIGPLRGAFKLPTLMFTFGFPITYALALPGVLTLRYWLRLLAVALISYFVCAIAVAIICDGRLTATFMSFGIELQPEWRRESVATLQYYMWMMTVRLYPTLIIIALALHSGQFRKRSPNPHSGAVRLIEWSVAGTLAALLIACVGFDGAATARIAAVDRESIHNRLAGLEKRNPDLGPGLVKLAEWLRKQSNYRSAFNAYRLALPHLADKALQDARTNQAIVHENLKAEMLENSRRRRE